MFAGGVAADDHLSQLVHVRPVQRTIFERLLKVAGFQTGLVLAVDHDTAQRRTATASSSALPRKFEPMALMCVPSAIQWPFSTGSRLVVAVMIMSFSSAAISGRGTGITSV